MDHATPSNHEDQTQRAAESLKRQFGPFCSLLAEPDLVELNTDGAVWAERLRQRMHQVGTMPPASAESFIGTVASTLRRTVTPENLILQCELPGYPLFENARFESRSEPVQTDAALEVQIVAFIRGANRWGAASAGHSC